MPNLAPLFPLLLAVHVALAISLFVPSLLLPFTLRNRSVERGFVAREPGRFMRALPWLQARDGIVTDSDREAWRAKARRQRHLAYAITTAVGFIAFLMPTKWTLW